MDASILTTTTQTVQAHGIHLALDRVGDQTAQPIILNHGFGQTRHTWRHSAAALAERGWQAISYDARGHGDSGRPADGHYQLDHFVNDFRRIHRLSCCGESALPVVVGASMGGLIALLAHGEVPAIPLRALILVDIAPRWEQQGVSRMLNFMQRYSAGFNSLEEARAAVRAYLPQRENPGGSLQHSLRQHDDGRWHWHWDPRMLEHAQKSQQYQQRLADAARRVKAPTLLISGGNTDMLNTEHIAELRALIPHAQHVVVPRAAHTVAGDDNDQFNSAIMNFLDNFDQFTATPNVPKET